MKKNKIPKGEKEMKNAKKILLLVLSLIMLVGIFAVWALAEEAPATATVVYPDGKKVSVEVGKQITPEAFVTEGDAKLYYGEGNTLFKDDATEGWIFTVEGEAEPLASLTVTAEMAGKKILASGADQVYSTVKIHFPEGDYYKWIRGNSELKLSDGSKYYDAVYALAGTSGSKNYPVKVNDAIEYKTVEYSVTKRVAGDYVLYFTDVASLSKFFTTSVSMELGGVLINYQDLRSGSDTKIDIKLYADHEGSFSFSWEKNGYDRPNTDDRTGLSSLSSGGSALVEFDMNGHIVNNTYANSSAPYCVVSAMKLYLYSSKDGAHWYQNGVNTAFYVSDDGSLYLGYSEREKEVYKDTFSVHCKALFAGHYGGGAAIYGGHYYQTAATSAGGFVRISRRIGAISGATFYVQPGQAVFYDPQALDSSSIGSGTAAIKNCTFYGTDTTAILNTVAAYNSSNAYTGGKAKPKFDSCAFYGLTLTVNGGGQGSVTADSATGCTFNNPITYKTVTWLDGTKESYFAHTKEEAEAYLMSLKSRVALGSAFAFYENGKYVVVYNPKAGDFIFDASLNAEQTVVGERQLVYYTVDSVKQGMMYFTTDNLATYLTKMVHGGATITVYQDTTTSSELGVKAERVDSSLRSEVEAAVYKLDLNGHTIKFTKGSGLALNIQCANFYLYSSREGGVIDAPSMTLARSNNDDYKYVDGKLMTDNKSKDYKETYGSVTATKPSAKLYIGELNATKVAYGENLTMYCGRVNDDLYGSSFNIYGGTFIQKGTNPAKNKYFLLHGREGGGGQLSNARNATFIITIAGNSVVYMKNNGDRTFTDCTFISTNPAADPFNTATATKKTTFVNCNFINVIPAYVGNTNYAVYTDCAYGTTAAFTMENVAVSGTQYFAHGTEAKTITANGVTYVLDGVLISDPATQALKLTHEGAGAEYWALGAIPAKEAPEGTKKIEGGKLYSEAYYNYAALEAIGEDGKILSAGEATVEFGYAKVEDVAFTYQVGSGEMEAVVSLGDAEKDGALFYETLNDKSNLKIVMYADIVLHKGVLFGTFKDVVVSSKTYQIINTSGNVDWDLNGKKVTMAADATSIPMVMEKEGQGVQTIDVLHYVQNATFKLYSSVDGGQYINETTHNIFGVHKGSDTYGSRASSYALGCGNQNLTVTSAGTILYAYEANKNGPGGYNLGIDGGTYIYTGTGVAFLLGQTNYIKNAKILATNAATRLVSNNYWVSATVTAENTVFVAKDAGTEFIDTSSTNKTLNGTHSVSITDCTFIGGNALLKYSCSDAQQAKLTYKVFGSFSGDSVADLALYYTEAPAGKTAAYTSVEIAGVGYKVLGYHDSANIVTVDNKFENRNEAWVAGAIYVYEKQIDYLYEQDGVWYYRPDAEWSITVGGASVSDPLAAGNAGETVVIEVINYTPYVLYFTILENGELTYYCGDTAEAALVQKLASIGQNGFELKLYSDIDLQKSGAFVLNGNKDAQYYFDLNGYTWTLDAGSAAGQTFTFQAGDFYFYSSVEDGKLVATAAKSLLLTDTHSIVYIGEKDISTTAFGANLTVECKKINDFGFYGSGLYIYGGTFVQSSADLQDCFIYLNYQNLYALKNATIIVNNASCIFRVAGKSISGNIENCSFICESVIPVFGGTVADDFTRTFANCDFYNATPSINSAAKFTFNENCNFNYASVDMQANGYIAYTGETVKKTIAGKEYTFVAKLVSEASVIDWGFGLPLECWAKGLTVTRENLTLDDLFIYAFEPVTADGNPIVAESKIVSFVDGKIAMSLTLENLLIFNLHIAEGTAITEVSFAGKTVALRDLTAEDGYYVLTLAVSPTDAAEILEIVFKTSAERAVDFGLESYANTVLADSAYASVHNLTYAVVKYVEAMAGKTLSVAAPAGYEAQILTAVQSENTAGLLSQFSLRHTEDMAIAIIGEEGTAVTVTFANGSTASGNVTVSADEHNLAVVFDHLNILAFIGEMEIVAGSETYSYSLANYLYGLEDDADKEKVQALYNYAFYANAYVNAAN